jgi:hypothetical protein
MEVKMCSGVIKGAGGAINFWCQRCNFQSDRLMAMIKLPQ